MGLRNRSQVNSSTANAMITPSMATRARSTAPRKPFARTITAANTNGTAASSPMSTGSGGDESVTTSETNATTWATLNEATAAASSAQPSRSWPR